MTRPRILLTGPDGQVGWELRRSLAPLGDVLLLSRQTADLSDRVALEHAVRAARPNLVVNAAAYTAVDRAEQEPELARAVNALAPQALARTCADLGVPLLHYSTDYVFDGAKGASYTESDRPAPLGVYGATKLEGEQLIAAAGARSLTLRISWVYATRGHNFARTILRLAREREVLRVVDDQVGSPTWARAVADASAHAALRLLDGWTPPPVLHLPAAGQTTWCGFARALLPYAQGGGAPVVVEPIATAAYPAAARRPAWSVLDGALARETLGIALPGWREQLALAMG